MQETHSHHDEDPTYHQRVAEVHTWQRYYHMQPRNDSQLTVLYAKGNLPNMTADEVARELLCTDVIYKFTLYEHLLEDFMREVARRLRLRYRRLSWKDTWYITRFYAPPLLKLMCVQSAGLVLPDRMPDDMVSS